MSVESNDLAIITFLLDREDRKHDGLAEIASSLCELHMKVDALLAAQSATAEFNAALSTAATKLETVSTP